MKKILSTIIVLFALLLGYAQNTTLTFVGKDRTGQDYVRLDRISVFNQTQLWHNVQYYPDTFLTMNAVGIDDYENYNLQLMQNVPNPFDGTTDFALTLPDAQDVVLEIFDMNGKMIVNRQFPSLEAGMHQFRATLTSPQTYLLSASTHAGVTSIKMVNIGNGGDNAIAYLGMSKRTITVELQHTKGYSVYPFIPGDYMKYVGYATIDGVEITSSPIDKYQYGNELISLNFDVERPEVVTNVATNLSAFAVTLNGKVTDDNNALVSERGFCYQLGNTLPTIDNQRISSGSGEGAFSASVSGLEAGQTYSVRAYAYNAIGLAYGEKVTFTTSDTLPVVTTTQPTQLASTSFVSGGQVLTANSHTGQITARGVCWSTNPNPTMANTHTSDGTGLGSFTSNVVGLDCGTTYYVRAYAKNGIGTAYGNEFSVTTLPPTAPEVHTLSATMSTTANTMVVNGNVASLDCAPLTARGVCYGTSHNPTIAGTHTTEGNATGNFTSSINLTSLNTTYYVRAYATNSVGTAYGEEMSVTSHNIPTVTTTSVTSITDNSATSGGNVTAGGGATVTARGVCWSTSQNPTINNSHTTNGSGTGSFSSSITGLSPNTTYYVRAYATNCMGTAYGSQKSFTTISLPTVTTTSVTSITDNSATSGGNVTADGGANVTARGVCWSTSQNPTISNSHTTNGTGTGSFSSSITGLSPNTTYYVRAYATNSAGTAYGSQKSFTTISLPTVTTTSVTSITHNSATSGGNVTFDGGAIVTARGVCWSTSQNPTINNSHTTNGTGTGSFSSSMTGLSPNTTYYVRAYATNSVGTAYGSQKSFTTISLPTVTTTSVTSITHNSATSGGNVTFDGGATVTARGVCWSTNQNPTINNSHTTNGSGMGSFSSSMTGLSPNTTYYVRAYATNSVGTTYGSQVSFTTAQVYPPTVTTNSVTNVTENSATCGGNVTAQGTYSVTVRGVCWSTSQNPTINNSHTTNGTGTGSFSSSITGLSPNTTYYVRAYATNSVGTAYGSQKSFTTAQVYPPTVTTNSVTNVTENSATCGGNVTAQGTYSVTACGVCWSTSQNPTIANSHTTDGSGTGSFSSSITGLSPNTTYYVRAYATNSVGTAYGSQKSFTTAQVYPPTVTTNSVTIVTENSATCGGNVTAQGTYSVTARGVCWSTSQNPTISSSHTTNGTGTGSFSSSITGLSPTTTYYVRAYATNSVGTAYGSQVSFTTAAAPVPCPGITTVTDYDGNTYNTVQIGSQCWMKENLKTTHYADGTAIPLGSSSNTITAYRYYPDNNSSNVSTYGYLYNWKAVMRNSSSSSANPSRVQGVCPTGWHVPSFAEWMQLTTYVKSQPEYVCGSNNTYIAKALASTTGWSSSSSTCVVGNNPSANNATGFSAVPAGHYFGYYGSFGSLARFWSATQSDSYYEYYNATSFDLFSTSADASGGSIGSIGAGNSVRCLRD